MHRHGAFEILMLLEARNGERMFGFAWDSDGIPNFVACNLGASQLVDTCPQTVRSDSRVQGSLFKVYIYIYIWAIYWGLQFGLGFGV